MQPFFSLISKHYARLLIKEARIPPDLQDKRIAKVHKTSKITFYWHR